MARFEIWLLSVLLLAPGAAFAALSLDEQKCVNGLNLQLAKVSGVLGKELCGCARDISRGAETGSVLDCVEADRKGKIAKAQANAERTETRKCSGDDRPDVFVSDALTLVDLAMQKETRLALRLFGSDAQNVVSASVDQDGSKCQLAVAKSLKKCQDTKLKEFNKCKKSALKAGKDPFPAGAMTQAELATCILDDPKGRIARACDLGSAGEKKVDKLRKALDKKCIAKQVDLCGLFPDCCPPCAAGDLDCIHQCLEAPLECDVCRTVSQADQLAVDCDAHCLPFVRDPGTSAFPVVPDERVAEECGLDPAVLNAFDATLDRPWAVIRYGKICHRFFPGGTDDVTHAFSATKTLGAFVTGMAAWETRDIPRTGPKTGTILEADRVDHWLDSFSFNPDAQIAHVLGMVAHNADLGFEQKVHTYDAAGNVQINRLSDIINTALAQDPERLGADLEAFTQNYLYAPLGMSGSTWTNGLPDKIFGFTWNTTLDDMARLGVAILHDGVWDGRRLLDPGWAHRMTHPSWEDANTSYGYLTWLVAQSNYNFGGILGLPSKLQAPIDTCSPPALHPVFPHGISQATDCYYQAPWSCDQEFDVGVWYASGAGGQNIIGHRGLDLVLVGKDLGTQAGSWVLWNAVRPALVAHDPVFAGDEDAFCAAYSAGSYAPDLPTMP